MSQENNKIINLMMEASRCNNPERLDKIAAVLERYSAWNDAVIVRAKARKIERELADEVALHGKVYR